MDEKSRQQKTSSMYRRLKELDIESIDSKKAHDTVLGGKYGIPSKHVPLNELLVGKNSVGLGNIQIVKASQIEMTNKHLKTNLQNIFKPSNANRNGIIPSNQPQTKKNFKIGRSFENAMRRTGFQGNTPKSRAEILRVESRDSSKGLRSSSLNNPVLKKSLESLKHISNLPQKKERPPLPKTDKILRKALGDTKHQVEYETNGNRLKVNVNVEIISNTNQKNEKTRMPNIPKAPTQTVKPEGVCRKKPSLEVMNILEKKRSSEGQVRYGAHQDRYNEFFMPQTQCLMELLKERGMNIDTEIKGKIMNIEKSVVEGAANQIHLLEKSKMIAEELMKERKMREAKRGNNLPLEESYYDQYDNNYYEYERAAAPGSMSKKSTPDMNLDQSIDSTEAAGPLRRNSSAICLSSNSKNQIKNLLSDNITRALFEKIYKNQLPANINITAGQVRDNDYKGH